MTIRSQRMRPCLKLSDFWLDHELIEVSGITVYFHRKNDDRLQARPQYHAFPTTS